jgi:hypothetical protein
MSAALAALPGMSVGGTRAARDFGMECASSGWRAPTAQRSIRERRGRKHFI